MVLRREDVAAGIGPAWTALADLVRSLDAGQLATPTRCEGWTVADVAAHVAGTLTDITQGRVEGQGTPEVTARQVDERKGRSGDELADEIEGAAKVGADLLAAFDDEAWAGPSIGGFDFTLGFGVQSLWYDAYLHADDIRAALGQPSVREPGLDAAVDHVVDSLGQREFGPATFVLDGYGDASVGGDGGPRYEVRRLRLRPRRHRPQGRGLRRASRGPEHLRRVGSSGAHARRTAHDHPGRPAAAGPDAASRPGAHP